MNLITEPGLYPTAGGSLVRVTAVTDPRFTCCAEGIATLVVQYSLDGKHFFTTDPSPYDIVGPRVEEVEEALPFTLNSYAQEVHAANKKWWLDINSGEPIQRNVGEMLCLVHSEISEALEGHRKDLQDDKLPHRKMFEVELVDALIRILDIGAGLGLDLEGAYREKMAYNAKRHDHTLEARRAPGGKAY
jgi:hypothetical protein